MLQQSQHSLLPRQCVTCLFCSCLVLAARVPEGKESGGEKEGTRDEHNTPTGVQNRAQDAPAAMVEDQPCQAWHACEHAGLGPAAWQARVAQVQSLQTGQAVLQDAAGVMAAS